jgi:uncharacterized protein
VCLTFGDATNGKESYGGGRYVYAQLTPLTDKQQEQTVTIDFNRAMHQSCAMNSIFRCPAVRKRIEAGEKYISLKE